MVMPRYQGPGAEDVMLRVEKHMSNGDAKTCTFLWAAVQPWSGFFILIVVSRILAGLEK
jgi:hypothetical protein